MSYEHEAYNGNVQYADCKLVSIQHGSARLHRRDAEVPILPCWPDRLRTHLPLQKTCSLLCRATQAARFRGSRVHRIFFSIQPYARDPGCVHTYVQILICVRSAAQYPSVKIIESNCMFNDDVLFIYIMRSRVGKYASPPY